MHKLVLLRHGESKWNLDNRFTGWTNVGLTKKGIEEAKTSGQLLKANNYKFDIVFTSVLDRAIETMKNCLFEMQTSKIIVENSWRLNERHYGALQGLNKTETANKYGEKQVLIWRRSYDIPPPSLEYNDKRHPRFDSKYKKLKKHQLPNSECLKDTVERIMPLWNEKMHPLIKSSKNLLIVAHGNSLRALIKHLDKISDEKIIEINIPTGIPLIYELDKNINPIKSYYLGDKKIVDLMTSKVKHQGKPE
ncbi:MAG: 2,3-diphosphoglycerate-dependent phosphoglycerate mutase [Candidatus Neomarinimicrobiota bacterium]